MKGLRAVALARSRSLCEHCGQPLDDAWELHHRRPGGMGGTRRPGQQEPSNVLALISWHHNMDPRSVHALGPRHEGGWLLSTHVTDPASVPVLHHGRRLVLLNDEGGVTPWNTGAAGGPSG
jgi:5-methylcytosine-specific restriction protein A